MAPYGITMSKSARAQALEMLRSDHQGAFVSFAPDASEYKHLTPKSEAAVAYWDKLKPRRYASVARVIGAIMHPLFFDAGTEPFHKKLTQPVRQSDKQSSPWDRLYINTASSFAASAVHVVASQAYADAETFDNVWRHIDDTKPLGLHNQLTSGLATSAIHMLTDLRNLPQITLYHEPNFPMDAMPKLASQSFGLPWRKAMTSINKLMAMKHVLSTDTDNDWKKFDCVLDPTAYVLMPHTDDTYSLQYKDLENMELPPGYTVYPNAPNESPKPLKSVTPATAAATIGCPITLLSGYMQAQWQSYIGVIQEQNLWDPNLRLSLAG